MLVFTAMAAIFLLTLLRLVLGDLPPAFSAATVALLLGQPVFTLRLAARILPVPRPLLVAAAAGWLATAAPLVVAGSSSSGPLVIMAVGVFVVVEAVAAGYLGAAARARGGASAMRLWVAAGATAVFALAVLAAGAGGSGVGAGAFVAQLARIAALLAAIGYVVAFVPPAFLRRTWQALAAYNGLRSLLAVRGGSAEVWAAYLAVVRGSTGALGAIALEPAAPGAVRIAAVDGVSTAIVGQRLGRPGVPAGEVTLETLASGDGWGEFADAVRTTGARIAQAIALGTDPDVPMVLVMRSHGSLFGDDERQLLATLGRQAAGLVEQRHLAAELGMTVDALRAASQAKSDFLASMSHELRTPLNAILGFSDLMRRETPDERGDLRIPAEWAEHIHRGGAHLVELVNDVLDLSRIEAGRLDLEPEPIDVGAAVGEAVAGLRPLADRKGHAIALDVPPGQLVSADRGRLRQILYNLLSNAIKFTPDGGRIGVDVRSADGEIRLTVVDTGVGIAPEDQDVVFEEFRQVGAGAGRIEGTGLGLALTRRLVEAHGGRIELDSTPGHGSRFTVVLPRAMHDPQAPAPPPAAAGPVVAGGTVLVVEDDPSAVRLLRAYLEPEGYEVRVSASGEQALVAARSEPPTAILLDVLLPGIDGWDVLRRLKADPVLRDIPVVMVTVVDERDVGLALGAVDYLVKPIDRDALLATLGRLTLTTKVRTRAVRILAIDDEPADLDLLEAALAPAGFEIVRTTDGQAGVDLARKHQPELVVCDLVMPGLDGFGVVAALKGDPTTADVPIIILTGHELSAADKHRLNGKVQAIVAKGPDARAGLRNWLSLAVPSAPPR